MTLVEVEGTHTMQEIYSSLDVHVGQCYSVLFTADQPPKDYYIVASNRFSSILIDTTAVLHYSNSNQQVSGFPPGGPTIEIGWSLYQARSIRYHHLLSPIVTHICSLSIISFFGLIISYTSSVVFIFIFFVS